MEDKQTSKRTDVATLTAFSGFILSVYFSVFYKFRVEFFPSFQAKYPRHQAELADSDLLSDSHDLRSDIFSDL